MLIRIKLTFLAFLFTLIPIFGMAQGNADIQVDNLTSSLRISVSTQLLIQRSSENLSNSTLFADQDKLFFQNPVYGMNLEWYGWANVVLNSRISYYRRSASQFEERTGIVIGIPGLFEDNYDFRLLLLEPGLKLTLPFKNFEVFWTGGPTFGFGSVKLEVQVTPVRYENGEVIPRYDDIFNIKQEEENSRNIGFNFSTGFSLPITSSFQFQAEIGYRNLSFEEFEIPAGQFRFKRLIYKLDSFTPTIGITYIIR